MNIKCSSGCENYAEIFIFYIYKNNKIKAECPCQECDNNFFSLKAAASMYPESGWKRIEVTEEKYIKYMSVI